jgi:hypothetical protein
MTKVIMASNTKLTRSQAKKFNNNENYKALVKAAENKGSSYVIQVFPLYQALNALECDDKEVCIFVRNEDFSTMLELSLTKRGRVVEQVHTNRQKSLDYALHL